MLHPCASSWHIRRGREKPGRAQSATQFHTLLYKVLLQECIPSIIDEEKKPEKLNPTNGPAATS